MRTDRVVHRVGCRIDGKGRKFGLDEGDFANEGGMLVMMGMKTSGTVSGSVGDVVEVEDEEEATCVYVE